MASCENNPNAGMVPIKSGELMSHGLTGAKKKEKLTSSLDTNINGGIENVSGNARRRMGNQLDDTVLDESVEAVVELASAMAAFVSVLSHVAPGVNSTKDGPAIITAMRNAVAASNQQMAGPTTTAVPQLQSECAQNNPGETASHEIDPVEAVVELAAALAAFVAVLRKPIPNLTSSSGDLDIVTTIIKAATAASEKVFLNESRESCEEDEKYGYYKYF